MSNLYATVDQLLARSSSLANQDIVELEAALEAASRGIDGYCARRFWLDTTATVRVFKACDWYLLDLGAHEIGSSTGVTIKTDDGTGTFATTLSSSDFQLLPVNAPYEATGARPYTTIRRLDGTWPISWTASERQELVQVTAKFGWPSVPAPVRDACLALAIYGLENPTGVRSEAIDGYSVSYTSAQAAIDSSPTLKSRLGPFRRMWAA